MNTAWVQVYDPLHSVGWSTAMAAAPIAVLLGLLLLGVAAHWSAFWGLATALATAILGFKMPWTMALASAGYGACFGLLPVGWIVLAAVFLFHLTVRSGQFEIVKRSVAALSPDRRVQALLIAFSFGAFLEGAAGFGAPVAISAALMTGIGFSPLYAAGLALVANTAPVAFGSLGIPIVTLAKVSGISELAISQVAGRQLPLFALIVPVWLIGMMSGWKGVKGCWPAILVSGGTYGLCQALIANFVGPALVGVSSGLFSLVALAWFLRVWQPAEVFYFPHETPPLPHEKAPQLLPDGRDVRTGETLPPLAARQVVHAWMPWLLLSLTVFVWGLPPVQRALDGRSPQGPRSWAGISRLCFPIPRLHALVYCAPPVVKVPPGADHAGEPEKAVYELNWLSTVGTGIFLAAVVSAFWLGIRPRGFLVQLLTTAVHVRWALFTIACTLAVAFVTKYSGSTATLGLAFTRTGCLYPFFAPLLGWLGVAMTGSDTSSNALFGSLQRITAEQLRLNPVLIVTSNSTGGVMGKMIGAQSIVVAAAATEQTGREGQILRFVIPASLCMLLIIALLTLIQAYLIPWTVPWG
jgi:lactate permease